MEVRGDGEGGLYKIRKRGVGNIGGVRNPLPTAQPFSD